MVFLELLVSENYTCLCSDGNILKYKFYPYGSCSEYRIVGKIGGGKFGKFDDSSMIHQPKTIQISIYN